MAFDAFIWFEQEAGGVPVVGETQDRSFAANNAFQITDYSWSAENTTSIGSASGGAGAGKAKLSTFKFRAPIGRQSTALFRYLVTGNHFKSATLVVRKAKNGPPIWQMDFKFVFVSALSQIGDPKDEAPVEEWTLAYGSVRETLNFAVNNVPAANTQFWSQVTNSDSDVLVP